NGTFLYVNNSNGIVVYDITDPAKPIRGVSVPGFNAQNLEISGKLLLSFGYSTLAILDISNPAVPTILSTFPINTSINSFAAAVSEGFLYVGQQIIDIRTPTVPVKVAEWQGGLDLAISGTGLYVADGAGLGIFDITTRTNPVRIASFPVKGNYKSLCTKGNYAYMSTRDNSVNFDVFSAYLYDLLVFDVSDPYAPKLVQRSPTGRQVDHVEIIGSTAFARSPDGVHTLDIRDPFFPKWQGTYSRVNDGATVTQNGYVWVRPLGGEWTMELLNGTVPPNLSFTKKFTFQEFPPTRKFLGEGNLIYSVGVSQFEVIDVTTPLTPKLVGQCPLNVALDLIVRLRLERSRKRVFIETHEGNQNGVYFRGAVLVVDVGSPSAPRQTG
ncbi:MAG TPA: hypothetical protein VM260_17055, partial [Pirellula sp.]|nr:hypothetical protein [Pirellula sp.]